MPRIIHVLYVKDENGWYAQCLDYDIGAQGASKEDAEQAFFRTWHIQIAMDRAHGRTPFDGLGKAPEKYWKMLEDVTGWHGVASPVEPNMPPAFMLAAQLERARASGRPAI